MAGLVAETGAGTGAAATEMVVTAVAAVATMVEASKVAVATAVN